MLGKEGLLGSGWRCGAGDCRARVVSQLRFEVEFMDLALENAQLINGLIFFSLIHSPTHSFMPCFLSIYYMPVTVLDAAVSLVSRQAPPLRSSQPSRKLVH